MNYSLGVKRAQTSNNAGRPLRSTTMTKTTKRLQARASFTGTRKMADAESLRVHGRKLTNDEWEDVRHYFTSEDFTSQMECQFTYLIHTKTGPGTITRNDFYGN